MKVKLYTARVRFIGKRYSKSLKLSTGDVSIELSEYMKNYHDYVQPLITYYTESEASLANALQVKSIVKKGEYIMGIFGGEEKRGKEIYAGLVIADEKYNEDFDEYYLKFYRMGTLVKVPSNIFKKYSCGFYNLIYRGCHVYTGFCFLKKVMRG